MKDNILVKKLQDGSWFIQGVNCYALVKEDGSKQIFAKTGKPITEAFRSVAVAMGEWCARNPPVVKSDPE